MTAEEYKSIWKKGVVLYGYSAAGELLTIKTSTGGKLDVTGSMAVSNLPSGNMGQQLAASSLSVVPGTNIADATYIGDIKFGEALPAGSALLGKVGIDQTTDGTTNAVHLVAGTALAGKFGIDQATANANEVVVKSITAGETHVGSVGGHTSVVTATLTRPADTPGAYSAKDEINSSTSSPTYLTFSNVARVNGGKGVLVGAIKKTNNAAASSQIRLHLYNAAPTVNNDHAQFAKLWADRAKEIGYIDFFAPVVEGTGSDMAESQTMTLNMPFTCVTGKDLYGRVEVITAGTAPTSAQVYEFTLLSLVD